MLLLSLFTGEIRDTDIWLHLKTGQHTLETHALTVRRAPRDMRVKRSRGTSI